MQMHRGFELIECVCVSPPECAGEHLFSVHDDLVGVMGDFKTETEATFWIDTWCYVADRMLDELLRR